jgi:hypothetical protein
LARTTPRTWSTGDLVTGTMLNTEIKNNLNETWPYTAKGDIAVATAADSLTKVSASANNTVLVADSTQSAGMKFGTASMMQMITETVVATGCATDITFSSIPAVYRNLKVVLSGRGSAATTQVDVQCQVNADTGSHYDYVRSHFYATSACIVNNVTYPYMVLGEIPANTAGSLIASGFEATFPSYSASSFQKGVHSAGNLKSGSATGKVYVVWCGGWWRDTSIVTSIKLYPSSGSFQAGTVASLYGF